MTSYILIEWFFECKIVQILQFKLKTEKTHPTSPFTAVHTTAHVYCQVNNIACVYCPGESKLQCALPTVL